MQVAGEEKFALGGRLRSCCEVELPFGRRMNQVFLFAAPFVLGASSPTSESLLKFALLYLSCRITGAKGDRNIHASVSEQLKKNFAKSRWKVSTNPSRALEIAGGDPSSLGGNLPMQGVESRDCSLKPTLPRDTVFRERERCCSAVLSPFPI